MKLIDAWTRWDSDGIISRITAIDPQIADVLDTVSDPDYFLNTSGEKETSAIVDKLITDGVLPDTAKNTLATIILNRFGENWKKIHKAYFTDIYEALENYSMEEVTTPDLTTTETPELTTTSKNDVKSDIYGYNSVDGVPEGKSHGEGEVKETGSKTTTNSGTNKITRRGNIGVTTSQQMLQSELDLRRYDFASIIYTDIDSILTTFIYFKGY